MIPQLNTKRLTLVPVTRDDQTFIFEGLSHPDVIRYYGVQYNSFEDSAAQMNWYDLLIANGSGTPWKILNRSTGEAIGVIVVYLYKPEHRKAETGFWILPQYQQKGFASEALEAVKAYWIKEKNIHRLEAFVEEGNEASSRLLEKAGFQYEGTMKECEMKHGKFINLKIYGLLANSQ